MVQPHVSMYMYVIMNCDLARKPVFAHACIHLLSVSKALSETMKGLANPTHIRIIRG